MSGERELWISRDAKSEGDHGARVYFWKSEPHVHSKAEGFNICQDDAVGVPAFYFDNPIPPGTKRRIKGVTIVEE